MPPVRLPLALLLCLVACGCRGAPLHELFVRGGALGTVEAGGYSDDARVAELIASWRERVARAQDRVALVTGLSLEEVEVEAVLAPLGDETRAFDLRTVLRAGRRQPLVRVNLERLANGRERLEALLPRALTLALLEVSTLRAGGALPPWLGALAGMAAAGDLAERLEAAVRADVLAGRGLGARVEPEDAAQAETTGAAGLLLLLERGGPEAVRAFLRGVADGDDPQGLLQRSTKEPGRPWGAARALLQERLDDIDARPWRLLLDLEAARVEAGRAGLLAALPVELPEQIADEVRVLSAGAALAEGDMGAARATLRALLPDVAGRLRDPLGAERLRVRAEAAPDGDLHLALATLARLELDYPRTGEVELLREELRLPDSPERVLASLRRRAQGPRLEALDLATIQRLLDLLVRTQRHGAAQRLLERLGERAGAPDLEALARVVAQAQRQPPEEALGAARQTVAAWERATGEAPRALLHGELVDRGTAAALALLEALSRGRGGARGALIALVGACVGAEAVGLLAAAWEAAPALLPADLEALAASVRVTELEVWVRLRAPEALACHDPEALFAALRLDLPEPWVRAHPDVPTGLRASEFATRRAALEQVLADGEVAHAPTLVARLLSDPSPVLRAQAVRVAGAAGFEALLRSALEDPAVSVRRTAALSLGSASDPLSLDALLRALAQDTSPLVRAAAALAAQQAAPGLARVVSALVAALEDEHPAVREALLLALREVPPETLEPLVLAALEAEVKRPQMRGSMLAALFGLLEPSLGVSVSYYPGMPPDEVRGAVARARARLAPRAPPRR